MAINDSFAGDPMPTELGKKVEHAKQRPTLPDWRQVEGAPKGIEVGPGGKFRNVAPTPPVEFHFPILRKDTDES